MLQGRRPGRRLRCSIRNSRRDSTSLYSTQESAMPGHEREPQAQELPRTPGGYYTH